jgi:phospholipase A1
MHHQPASRRILSLQAPPLPGRGSAARPGKALAALLLGLLPGLLLAVAGAQAAAGATAAGLAECAGIPKAAARLQCFDTLAAAQRRPERRVPKTAERAPGPRLQPGPAAEQPTPGTERAAAPAVAGDPSAEYPQRSPRRMLSLLPYRKNYILPVTYNANVNANLPQEPTLDLPLFGDDIFDKVEMKYQISFEVPLWTRLLNRPLDLYFGYTQLAFFQAYNQEYSSPFRETNYEPELGLHWQPYLRLGPVGSGWRLTSIRAAANHQSNGRAEPLSRSWNRLTGEAWVAREDLSLGLRLWTLLGSRPPDNPDITDYLGHGELRAEYERGAHRFGLMLRSPRHPTLQLDWSYPLGDRVRIYAQYFNGYGESLIDYDHSVNRIGVGFMLEDGG